MQAERNFYRVVQKMFESRISAGATGKLPGCEKPHFRALSSAATWPVIRGVVSILVLVRVCEVNTKVASQMLDDVTLSRLQPAQLP